MLIAVNPNPQPTNLDYRQVRDILGHLESRKLLAPLVVLQELAKNPALPLGVVRDYVARQLTVEGAAIEQDRAAIAKLTAETMQLRTEANELKTKVSVGGGGVDGYHWVLNPIIREGFILILVRYSMTISLYTACG